MLCISQWKSNVFVMKSNKNHMSSRWLLNKNSREKKNSPCTTQRWIVEINLNHIFIRKLLEILIEHIKFWCLVQLQHYTSLLNVYFLFGSELEMISYVILPKKIICVRFILLRIGRFPEFMFLTVHMLSVHVKCDLLPDESLVICSDDDKNSC